jgi:hypothetical protein
MGSCVGLNSECRFLGLGRLLWCMKIGKGLFGRRLECGLVSTRMVCRRKFGGGWKGSGCLWFGAIILARDRLWMGCGDSGSLDGSLGLVSEFGCLGARGCSCLCDCCLCCIFQSCTRWCVGA